jgi:hypothetical protein
MPRYRNRSEWSFPSTGTMCVPIPNQFQAPQAHHTRSGPRYNLRLCTSIEPDESHCTIGWEIGVQIGFLRPQQVPFYLLATEYEHPS